MWHLNVRSPRINIYNQRCVFVHPGTRCNLNYFSFEENTLVNNKMSLRTIESQSENTRDCFYEILLNVLPHLTFQNMLRLMPPSWNVVWLAKTSLEWFSLERGKASRRLRDTDVDVVSIDWLGATWHALRHTHLHVHGCTQSSLKVIPTVGCAPQSCQLALLS